MTYTVDEYINVIKQRLQNLQENFYPLQIASSTLKADISNRIWNESKNSENNDMLSVSPYGTKPIYVEDDVLPRRTGNKVGKRGKPITTNFFALGWAELKSKVGRKPAELTGALRLDFDNSPLIGSGTQIQIGFRLFANAVVAEGIQKKYGKLFKPTPEELAQLIRIIQLETIAAIQPQ